MIHLLVSIITVMIVSTSLVLSASQTEAPSNITDTSSRTTVISTRPASQCPLGCLSCSKWNGCVECADNFTWHVETVYMRKLGVCVRQCPSGYFRREFHHAPGSYRCIECKASDCAVCGERDFCDTCRHPYLEYRGTCILHCPDNLYHSKYTKDCYVKVDCLISIWSEWSQCTREGKVCGYKWGNQTRSRQILQTPSPNGYPCPASTQSQKCQLEKRYCDIDNSAAFFCTAPVSVHRHERRKEKRKRRCRLRKKAGRPCKREDNSNIPVVPANDGNGPLIPPHITDIKSSSIITHNSSSYYDYYKESAELLSLLNLQKNLNKGRNPKD